MKLGSMQMMRVGGDVGMLTLTMPLAVLIPPLDPNEVTC